VYDGANLIEEADAGGSLVALYAFGAGVDEPLAAYRGSTWEFYQADGLGSITSLSTTSGTVSDSFAYDSFGNVTSTTGGFTQPFRYTGREWEAETGLYYYRARYYDAQSGRFLSEDPIGFDAGNNFYSYVRNNPTNLRDPSGTNPNATTWPWVWPWVGRAGRGVITVCFATGVCETILIGTAGLGVIALLQYGVAHAPPIEADWRKRPQFQCGKKRNAIDDRCAKVKLACIEACAEATLPTNDRTSQGFPFFNCVNKCMEAAGCLGK
jgi:RHS repeat-associated protein